MSNANSMFDFSMMVFGIIYGLWFVVFLKVALGRYRNKVLATFIVWVPFAITGMYLQATNQYGLVLFRIIPEPLNTFLLFASWPILFMVSRFRGTTRNEIRDYYTSDD